MYGLRRVVITGLGSVSPCGMGVDQLWKSILEGESGTDLIQSFDTTGFPSRIGGEVKEKDYDPKQFLTPKQIKKMDKMSQYAVISAKEAVKDSKIDCEKIDPHKFGVIYGSGIGGLETIEKQHKNYLNKGPSKISPFIVPMMIIDMTSGHISMEFNAKGPNYSIVSACATGTHCIGEAARCIATGSADIVISGASEAAVQPLALGGFGNMKALSTNNDNPKTASRPFDKTRDGFVMAEGGGALVLEEYEHAKKRNAHIYAELIGYGLTGDAYHMTQPAPGGEGGARCMTMALETAKINPSEIDYYNAHGTSTPFNDLFETQALKTAFGDYAYKLNVSSTKAITGHTLAVAGALELIITLKAMQNNIVPPTWHLNNPDPECDLDYVPNEPREKELSICMSNSLGFGGHNANLIVKKI